MLFNSLSFLIFFPIVFLGYYAIPYRFRPVFLLFASACFYMAFIPEYILILISLTTVDYFVARLIYTKTGFKKVMLLCMSIFVNLGVLFFFKYFNFFSESIESVAEFLHWNYSLGILHVVVPLGLSFHAFQSLAYVIEVYRCKHEPEKKYLTYALYVMFFPQMVAGPIERPQHLLPQLVKENEFDRTKVRRGLEPVSYTHLSLPSSNIGF